MTSPWNDHVDELAAAYQRQRAQALEMRQRLRELSAMVTSSKGLVTAVAGAQGELRSLRFNSSEYRRMAPAELAHVVVDTVQRARESVLRQMLAELPSTSFGGVALEDVVSGDVDWETLLPERLPATDFPFPAPQTRPGRGRTTDE